MVYKIADDIISPLGEGTEQNYQALSHGNSALSTYTHLWNLPEPFAASLFTDDQRKKYQVSGLTLFESLLYHSISRAFKDTSIDVHQDRVVLIVSTTKGNISLLESSDFTEDRIYPGIAAKTVSSRLGLDSVPITVCNACISGTAALILAERLLDAGFYDYAIVSGTDIQNKFIVSGFQSFKALSAEPCLPFDMERTGLNLGEAVVTVILSRKQVEPHSWIIKQGKICNDAYHISSPSKQGEGSYKALLGALQGESINHLALVNVHGTATMYNDQMESVAVQHASLSDLPANGLKGYYGHTMGAAGLLETIITMKSLDDHRILGTKGFTELGVSGKINISASSRDTDKTSFVKLISGFGGCNAALFATKDEHGVNEVSIPQNLFKAHHVTISTQRIVVDGKELLTESIGKDMLSEVYKTKIGGYPKFYKMDLLSRLGFIASELLLQVSGDDRDNDTDDRAVVLFNRTSSIHSDRMHQKDISDVDNYYPSPSVFVYTLPNIVTGEIAIRNHYHGETSFYVLPEKDENIMKQVFLSTFQDSGIKSILGGWIDAEDESHLEADLYLLTTNKMN